MGSAETSPLPGDRPIRGEPTRESAPREASPEAILGRAFTNQYEVDTTAQIELVMRNRSGQERTRRFEAVQKIIDDRVHSIDRLFSVRTLEQRRDFEKAF